MSTLSLASRSSPPDSLEPALLIDRARSLANEIRKEAAQSDLRREAPAGAFVAVRQGRLGALRLPVRLGGAGGSIVDTIELVALLASGDSNVAHALRAHFNFVELLITSSDADGVRLHAENIASGQIYGGASTEIGTPRPGDIRTTLRADRGCYRLTGKKYYSTGTAYADWVNVSAIDDRGEIVRVVLPVAREGVAILDDWDGMGQRLSASGSITFDNVDIAPGEVFRRPSDSHASRHASTFRQLYLAACQAGIVRNVLSDAIEFVQTRARPITHSHAETAQGDYFVQRVVGDIASHSYAIDALIAQAARRIDDTHRAILASSSEVDRLLTESAIDIAKAQVTIGALALKAAETLFDAGGGSATSRSLNFDRHWRNIRTLLSHNPLTYKSKVVGDYLINRVPPPTTGGFF